MPQTRSEQFCAYASAVELLRQRFGDAPGREVRDHYDLERRVSVDWLQRCLPELADKLAPLRFRIALKCVVYGIELRLRVRTLQHGTQQVETQRYNTVAIDSSASPSPEASTAIRNLRDSLAGEGLEAPLVKFSELIGELESTGETPDLEVGIHLDDKGEIAQLFAAAGEPRERPQPVVFLFPSAVARYWAERRLDDLERESFQPGQRTVFLVFGLDHGIGNDLLFFAGRSSMDRLDPLLSNPLEPETVEAGEEIRKLRRASGVWLQPVSWLRPDLFDLDGVGERFTDQYTAAILFELRMVRTLLAAIFLADNAERIASGSDPDAHRVEYRGYGRVSIEVSREQLRNLHGENAQDAPSLDDLYRLYRYAYEGYSADKVEFAQQFLSLLVKDLSTLVSKAAEVEGATKQTYDRALQEKVAEYFDTRHKIQERIKTAVAEASNATLSLTREVSSDLYKMTGLILAALAGILFKPEITAEALAAVSAAITIYSLLVASLHFPTLLRTHELRLEQHRRYIRSFGDVLRPQEVEDYIADPHLRQSEKLLVRRVECARTLYFAVLLVAFLGFVKSITAI